MLVIINALKSISRSKVRNILIGIIVIAIAASSCVALAIRNAAGEAETAGLESVKITGSISADRQKLMEESGGPPNGRGQNGRDGMRNMMSQYPDLTLGELLVYAESDYLSDFTYMSTILMSADGDLEAYGSEDTGIPPPDSVIIGGRTMAMGDFTVTGYSSENAMTKFQDKTAEITEGEMFDTDSDDMSCIISKELALFNGLSVGDEFTLANPNFKDGKETYTFKIIGIYTDSLSSSSGLGGQMGNMPMFSPSQDPANLICVSYGSLKSIANNSKENAVTSDNEWGMAGAEFETGTTAFTERVSGTFVFSSKENYENFQKELREKGLSEYYILTSADLNNYDSAVIPLQNLSDFAATLLLVVLVIGAVILIVINVFNIRERKYEVGVLTAIGIKKGKVAMQFVTELLCVTLAAIIIGAGVGSAISVPVANNLLSDQIEQAKADSSDDRERGGGDANSRNQNGGFGGGDFGGGGAGRGGFSGGFGGNFGGGQMIDMFGGNRAGVTYLDQVNATVNFAIVGQLILIGLALTVISSLAAVVFVMRYEPLKILANRA